MQSPLVHAAGGNPRLGSVYAGSLQQTLKLKPHHLQPSQPSSSNKFCFLYAATSSLQRCFSDVILGSELTLCKSRITLVTQTATYQPFLSSPKYLLLFVPSWTNLFSYISYQPTTSHPVSISFPLSLQSSHHSPLSCGEEGITRTPDSANGAACLSSPRASCLLCLVKADSTP